MKGKKIISNHFIMKRCINVDSVNVLCERKVEIKEELASQPMGNLLHRFLHCGNPDPINTGTSALCGIFLQNTPAVSILSPPTDALTHNTESHSQKMSGCLPFATLPHRKRRTDNCCTLLTKIKKICPALTMIAAGSLDLSLTSWTLWHGVCVPLRAPWMHLAHK